MPPGAASYSEEQERLQGQTDAESEEVTRPIPKAPEVNPEVYRDVVSLVFRGFLTTSVVINDVLFVFKSLNQHEFELTRLMGGYSGENATPRFWDLFLAHGVFMIDGQNVLVDRQRWMPRIANTFRDMPSAAKNRVIRLLSELNRRSSNATILTESYVMEAYSRYRWAQVHGLDLTLPSVTGIAGTALLGLNWAQLTWRALNYFEDMSAAYERDWENAKFVGSCMAGKGIQKIYNRDHDRHRKEAEERIARKDRLLRHIFEGLPLEDDGKTYRNGQVVEIAQTVEQLTDQLDRSLRGEADFHDRVVQQYEQRARTRLEQQQTQYREMAKEAETRFEGRYAISSTSLDGLSPQEVQERILRRKQIEAQNYAKGIVAPDEDKMARQEKFLERYGLLGPGVDTSTETTPQDPSTVIALPPVREPGKPWRP